MQQEPDKESVLLALKDITETEESLLSYAKDAVKESAEHFVSEKIGKLFHLTSVYKRVFERHPEIREAFDDWHEVEHEWDTFLKDVDAGLDDLGSPPLTKGQVVPVDLALIDARSGESNSLKHFVTKGVQTKKESEQSAADISPVVLPPSSQSSASEMSCTSPALDASPPVSAAVLDEFQKRDAAIVLVSFGEREGALKWLADTGCPFDLLLDKSRQLYHSFGLKRSVYKVWSISCLLYYAEQMRAGRTLPSPYEDIHDDPNQMGGDFIIAKDGQILLAHCSQTASDRPSVDSLLQTLESGTVSNLDISAG
ncbi:hypothetical protein BaRGS_00021583 [Batillaria attramentaria]|uniref:Uncharacterized protein n=1 Tax=Batillaria attramentaria TaxID=370345 RepID=A0ABD0KIP3_9CAEN